MGFWREFHSKYRTFGGKRYELYRSGIRTKREAQADAKKLRRKGWLVRITKWEPSNLPAQYLLYVRMSRK